MAAITFSDVWKRFELHRDRPRSFQEMFLSALGRGRREPPEEFWALRNINFEILRGEACGIIGPNGAGKSSLLKLMSRIIEPTSGHVTVNGRVGALLELGAGFHPDLTGRENIYLQGSILGLGRADIERKLDAIIEFAELERFIDVPVRHYSSGMYVRLGFSVAVHTDPEVLLVDEVLAVGDQSFQHKSLERILSMRQQGITICFVSHDTGSIQRLCSRAMWLEDGEVMGSGDVTDTVSSYLRYSAQREASDLASPEYRGWPRDRRWGSGEVQIVSVSFHGGDGVAKHLFSVGEPLTISMRYRANQKVERPVVGLAIHRSDGLHICGPNTAFSGLSIPLMDGDGEVEYRVDSLPLLEGTYMVSTSIHNQADTKMYDYHDRLHTFRVRQVEMGERYGLVTMKGQWQWNPMQST